MELSIIDIIDLLVVFISLLFSFFLLSTKSGNRLSNILIALFLIVNAQDTGAGFVSDFIYPKYPNLGMLINMSIFFKMPLLYLYILSVIYSDFKLKRSDFIHVIPFIVILLVFIPRYFSADYETKMALLEFTGSNRIVEIKISYILVHLQLIIYLSLSILAIRKYKKLLLENFSNASMFHYRWLFQLIILMIVVAIIASFKNVFMFLDLEYAHYWFLMLVNILILIFVCWVVIRALQTPELFKGIDSNISLVSQLSYSGKNGTDRSELNSSNTSDKEDVLADLKKWMLDKRPYLDASLNLYDLAKQINTSSRDLSILINRDLGQHFFDFVNSFRIEEAKDLLNDPQKQELTVLEILYQVGFNSKSSFNTAFKKHTNMTPTEYRKSSLSAR